MREIKFIGKLEYDYEDRITIGDDTLVFDAEQFDGEMVIVNYLISNEDLSENQFIEQGLETIFGKLKVGDYPVHGSEYTGFMWNDGEFKVGDHNILKNLSKEIDSYGDPTYCYFKLTLHDRDEILDKLLK